MRRVTSIVGLLIIGVIFASILGPLGPPVPEFSLSHLPSGQEERTMHLQLGLLYERTGMLGEAQAQYEKSINAQEDEITTAAMDGLKRVLTRQHNPWLGIQASVRAFLVCIAENGLKLLIAGSVAWLAWQLVRHLPRRPGYQILPFQDHSGKKLGSALSNAIYTTLQAARLTHLTSESGMLVLSENLNMPSFGILGDNANGTARALTTIESLSVGTSGLLFGQFITTFQRWANVRKYELSGHIYHFGSLLRLEIEMINAYTEKVEHIWRAEKEIQKKTDALEESILELTNNLAYQILYDLCPGLRAGSWRSLRLFTEALRDIQRYQAERTELTVIEDASRKLENAIALDPGYVMAKYNLGNVYNGLGQYRQAINLLKDVKETNAGLQLEAAYNLGLAYYHLFQDWAYEHAVVQFQYVLNRVKIEKAKGSFKPLAALAHCGLANVYAQQARRNSEVQAYLDKVQRHHDQAINLAGDNHDIRAAAHVALGIAFSHQNDLEYAIDQFKTAIYLKPDYPVTYAYLSDIYLGQENLVEAIRWLQRATDFNPHYEYAHYKLGEIYRARSDTDLAMEAYQRAPHIADARNGMGKLLAESGRLHEALTAFRQAIELNSQLAEAYSNLAWYIIKAGLHDRASLQDAKDSARRALQLNKGTRFEWHSRDVLGWVYHHCGMLDEAERELKNSIEADSNRAQPRCHLAMLYLEKGEREKARQTLAELFGQTEEKGPWRDEAVEMMRELETSRS
jgi:tetratricopeptide (TPR) repeat protein